MGNEVKKSGLKKSKLDVFKEFYGELFVEKDVSELEPSWVWCMDATYFGPVHNRTNPKGVALFSVLNWGSRRVLGYIVVGNGKDINSDHVLSCLETCIRKGKTAKPKYVHFDQHPAHMSNDLREFFWQEEICVSVSQGKFKNQQAESYHSQLKSSLIHDFLKTYSNQRNLFEKKLHLDWLKYKDLSLIRRSQLKEVRLACFKLPEFTSFVTQNINRCIESINESKIQAVGLTRNIVDAFFYITEYGLGVKENSKHNPLSRADIISNEVLVRGVNIVSKDLDQLSPEEIENLAKAIHGDPLGIEKTQIKSLSILMGELKQIGEAFNQAENDRLKEKVAREKEREGFLQGQAEMLTEIRKLETEMVILRLQKEKVADEKRLKALRREKRNRPKNPSSALLREHFDFLMESLKSEPDSETFPKLRERMLFLMLFVTGLRISEVQQLQVYHVEKLFLSKQPSLRVYIKKQRKYHHAFLSKEGLDLMLAHRPMFKKLKRYLTEKDAFLFCDKTKQNTVLNRDYLNREANTTLKHVLVRKYKDDKFTSHSFRRGLIENLWLVTGDLEFVCQFIGHEKIATTHGYITKSTGVLKRSMDRHGLTPNSDSDNDSSKSKDFT